MARLTADQKDLLIADYHTGHFTQRELARKYDVSTATVNKMTKGIEPKHYEKVNAMIAIHTELSGESEQEVNAVHQKVNDQLRRANLVYGVTEKLLRKAELMADQIDTATDLKALVDAVDKGSITLKVNDRHAPKIDVSQTLAQQNTSTHTEILIVEDTKEA